MSFFTFHNYSYLYFYYYLRYLSPFLVIINNNICMYIFLFYVNPMYFCPIFLFQTYGYVSLFGCPVHLLAGRRSSILCGTFVWFPHSIWRERPFVYIGATWSDLFRVTWPWFVRHGTVTQDGTAYMPCLALLANITSGDDVLRFCVGPSTTIGQHIWRRHPRVVVSGDTLAGLAPLCVCTWLALF